MNEHREYRPVKQPGSVPNLSQILVAVTIFVVIPLILVFVWGYKSGEHRSREAASSERETIIRLYSEDNEKLESENAGLRQQMNELEGEVDALREDLESQTSTSPTVTPNGYEPAREGASIHTVSTASVVHRVVQPPKPKQRSMRSYSKDKHITKADYRYIVKDACAKFQVPKTKHRDLLVRWGLDIVYTGQHPDIPDRLEKRESGGSTRANSNPPYKGLKQFDERWHATPKMKRLAKKEKHKHAEGDWRNCPVCSVRRFVIASRDHDFSYSGMRVHFPTLGR